MVNLLGSFHPGSDWLCTYAWIQTSLCFGGSKSHMRVHTFFVSRCCCGAYLVIQLRTKFGLRLLCHCERKCYRLGILCLDQTLVSFCCMFPNILGPVFLLWVLPVVSCLSHGLEILAYAFPQIEAQRRCHQEQAVRLKGIWFKDP